LLKPAPAQFLGLLWSLWTETDPGTHDFPPAGATSVPNNDKVPHAFWYAVGYRPTGSRAVRIDMLERLAQEIRKARDEGGKEGFETNQRMMSLVGVSGETFDEILSNLGYKKQTIERAVKPKRIADPAPVDTENKGADENPAEAAAPSGEPNQEPAVSEPAADVTETVTAQADATSPPESPPDEGSGLVEAATGDQPTDETNDPPPLSSASEPTLQETQSSDEGAADITMETVTVWRYQPPRQPRRDGGRDNQRRGKPQGKNASNDKRGASPQGKGGKRPPKDKGPRTFSSAPNRKRKEADPDSPFAVLASLKKSD
ncbi:MAG: hypothetical protein AAF511_00315, partial [Pseudomonadota bacterium]